MNNQKTEEIAFDLILTKGDVVSIPVALIRRIGLEAAVFLREAAYLSAIVSNSRQGWFYLDQTGPARKKDGTIFERLGSWENAIGVKKDAQKKIRKKLLELELLQESVKGMTYGRVQYRVDPKKYHSFLASCSTDYIDLLSEISERGSGEDESLPTPPQNDDIDSDFPESGGVNISMKNPKNPPVIKEVEQDVENKVEKTTTQPVNSVVVFLKAAGTPTELAGKEATLASHLADASHEQAGLAGFTWKKTAEKKNPIGLAIDLCKRARRNELTPDLAQLQAVKVETANIAEAKFKALLGFKFEGLGVRFKVAQTGIDIYTGLTKNPVIGIGMADALNEYLPKIESGQYKRI